MKKRNILLTLSILILSFWSCEEDDICVSGSTPKLTVVLKSSNVNDTLSPTILVELLTGNNILDTLYNYVATDSIKIPLYGFNSTQTQFRIRKNLSTINNIDTITINYTTQESYVSKACGFKIKYNNLAVNTTNNQIVNTELLTNKIEDESTTNLYIYYNN